MLQTRTVEPGTLELLKRLMPLAALERFYLVGGTALALQLGHRVSVDLDLFTPEPFEKTDLMDLLNDHFEDAEQYADPAVFDQTISWAKVKAKVLDAVQAIV